MSAIVTVHREAEQQAAWYRPADHKFFEAIAALTRRLPAVRAIDVIDLRTPGVATAWEALRALKSASGAWNGWVRLTPAWSVDDWYEERDYAAGWTAQNSEDAWGRIQAHRAVDEVRNLLDAWSGDGNRLALAMLREHVAWADTGRRVEVVTEQPVGAAWPSTKHLRLHYLADRQGGWICRDCGAGLVDVCRDDDIATDENGGRYVNPASGKRLPTVDHGVPQSLQGSDLPANLALVCRPCNSKKGAA